MLILKHLERNYHLLTGPIYTLIDAQIAYDSFLGKFNTILNSTIHLVQKLVKCYSKSNKPWVCSAIKIIYSSQKLALSKLFKK